MIGLVLHWFLVSVLVAMAIVCAVVAGYLRSRTAMYPYRTTWIRCNRCLDGYFVPIWEAEGFVCGNCRNRHNH
jgi:hypothetical protein